MALWAHHLARLVFPRASSKLICSGEPSWPDPTLPVQTHVPSAQCKDLPASEGGVLPDQIIPTPGTSCKMPTLLLPTCKRIYLGRCLRDDLESLYRWWERPREQRTWFGSHCTVRWWSSNFSNPHWSPCPLTSALSCYKVHFSTNVVLYYLVVSYSVDHVKVCFLADMWILFSPHWLGSASPLFCLPAS